ncbi:MAG: hypothetical protein LCI00_02495 [Chloroflexi bacterium]|nr:hypothetical protein [Chloroflexota bacterium]MCC6893538.1 hypothetical protein [Anaerolineae bacterium]
MSIVQNTPYQEFADFITSSPSLEQIAEYRLSDASESRVSYLLDVNRNGTISKQEQNELDDYTRLEHLMRIVKIRAFAKLSTDH